jgi:hypothetical protein
VAVKLAVIADKFFYGCVESVADSIVARTCGAVQHEQRLTRLLWQHIGYALPARAGPAAAAAAAAARSTQGSYMHEQDKLLVEQHTATTNGCTLLCVCSTRWYRVLQLSVAQHMQLIALPALVAPYSQTNETNMFNDMLHNKRT